MLWCKHGSVWCACVWECRHEHAVARVWQPGNSFQELVLSFLLDEASLSFLLCGPLQASWWRSHLYFLSHHRNTRMTDVCPCIWLCYMGSRDPTQVLKLVWPALLPTESSCLWLTMVFTLNRLSPHPQLYWIFYSFHLNDSYCLICWSCWIYKASLLQNLCLGAFFFLFFSCSTRWQWCTECGVLGAKQDHFILQCL